MKNELFIVATLVLCTTFANAATYYASPDGTASAAGTEADPFSLSTGISKVNGKSNTLILKSGRYTLSSAIAFNGTSSGNAPTEIVGETGNPEDVVLDAQGASEVMRINQNVIISGITMMNGSNEGFNKESAYKNRAAGVRVGWDSASDTLSVVSNCAITCCTNAFDANTKVSSDTVYGGAVAVFDTGLLVDSYVTNNTAAYYCSGVVVKNGTVRNCVIADNSAESCAGGLLVERG